MTRPTPAFVFAPNMHINKRLAWILVLGTVGVAVQLLFSLVVGWFGILAAVLLGLVSGRSNEPDMVGRGEWQNVTTEELGRAGKLVEEAKRVRAQSGAYSAGSGAGCALFVFVLMSIGAVALFLTSLVDQGTNQSRVAAPVAQGGSLALLFVVDALTLLVPIWLSGRVRAWEPPDLSTRMEQLAGILRTVESDPKLAVGPSLLVSKTRDGAVPTDVRLMAKIRDSDSSFVGIQVQVSFNSVQSRKYPYTYCVVIAKPEFGLIPKARQVIDMPPEGGFRTGLFSDANAKREAKFARFGDALVELKKEGEVEIAVVRQNTGEGSRGYTTSPDQALRVFNRAYQLAIMVTGTV